jgi:hypothetical protein
MEKLVKVIERSVKKYRNKRILMVRVLREHHGTQDATCETKEWIRKKYLELL